MKKNIYNIFHGKNVCIFLFILQNNYLSYYFTKSNENPSVKRIILNKLSQTTNKIKNFCLKNNINMGYGISSVKKIKEKNYYKILLQEDNMENIDSKFPEEESNSIKNIVNKRLDKTIYDLCLFSINKIPLSKRKKKDFFNDSTKKAMIKEMKQDIQDFYSEILSEGFRGNPYQTYLKSLLNQILSNNDDNYKIINTLNNLINYHNEYLTTKDNNDPIFPLFYDNKPNKTSNINYLYQEIQPLYRFDWGCVYGIISFDREYFKGYSTFLQQDIVLNFLTTFTIHGGLTPLLQSFYDNTIYWKSMTFIHGLIGVQVPDFFMLLPSTGDLYMKNFLSWGFLLNDDGLNFITGLVIFVGWKKYGYLKFEVLNNFHEALNLYQLEYFNPISYIKKIIIFFQQWYSKGKIESMTLFFQKTVMLILNIIQVSWHFGNNQDNNTPLIRYFNKKMAKVKKLYMEQSLSKTKNQKKSINSSNEIQLTT